MSIVCNIIFVVIFIKCSKSYDEPDLPEKLKEIENYGVYFNLNSTLECYRNYYQLPVVKVLLNELTHRYPDIGLVQNPNKNHPFIAVEGVHRKTRNIVGYFLAKKMGADIVYNPPQFMVSMGANFSDLTLRKAFFGLGGYAAACTARQLTRTVPAIITGHWMSQMAFAIAKVYDRVPPPESKIYTWPADLYMPDIVFFVNSYKKKPTESKAQAEFLPKFLQVFRNWRHPPVFEIKNIYLYEDIANKMLDIINKEFQGNYKK
uniref:Uncharacterized protein n=1 Tax=Homalodisca liturata TaxID=320908 RepID=A0A1B6HLM5_9HEMI